MDIERFVFTFVIIVYMSSVLLSVLCPSLLLIFIVLCDFLIWQETGLCQI